VTAPFVDLQRRVADLRSAFDRAFGEPPAVATTITEDLLGIRIAGDPYALVVSELSGVVSGRKVVALPSRRAELLGVAGIRGGVVPVYALAGLLGYDAAPSAAAWLALCGSTDPVALAFDQLEGFLRVPRADLHATDRAETARRHVTQVVRVAGITRRVIDTRSTLAALQSAAGASGSTKDK
jgi:chemotaxis signal transduction protein